MNELPVLNPIPFDKIKQIEAIYKRIPKVDCKRLCEAYCGVITMSKLEWDRICLQLRRVPKAPTSSLDCPMLKNGNECRVYAIRPAICRVWGAVKQLSCPHGCEPTGWLSDEDAHSIFEELDAISGEER